MNRLNQYQPSSLFPGIDQDNRILNFLRSLPHLQFTNTGLFNICKRFGLTMNELEEFIDRIMNEHKICR